MRVFSEIYFPLTADEYLHNVRYDEQFCNIEGRIHHTLRRDIIYERKDEFGRMVAAKYVFLFPFVF